ncbi:MAG TPA: hypothetical protein VGK39_08985, partial [Cyclobacteriaceae bacterium]
LPALETAVIMKPVTVTPNGFRFQAGRVRYEVQVNKKGLDVLVNVPEPGAIRSLIPATLQRALHFNHLDFWERRAKSFIYDIFDYITQSSQLSLHQTYVHASSMERNGKAIALLAWGGIGKTTSLLKLILEDGWNFLSDDLGLLDANGQLYRSPKNLQVYGYNLQGQPRIESALFSKRTILDALSWSFFRAIKGNHRVRRRISAEKLFGKERIAKSGQLSQAFFLERHQGKDFRCERITAEALADRCVAILMHEISPYTLVASAIHGAGNNKTILSPGKMYSETHKILVSAFSRVPCEVISIPLDAGPNDLVAFLRPRID